MKVSLIRRHRVQTAHQRPVVAIQATAKVSDGEAAVQPQHSKSPWAVSRFRHVFDKLDGVTYVPQVVWELAVGHCILLLMEILDDGGLGSHLGGVHADAATKEK